MKLNVNEFLRQISMFVVEQLMAINNDDMMLIKKNTMFVCVYKYRVYLI
jgi:hypothetical protein